MDDFIAPGHGTGFRNGDAEAGVGMRREQPIRASARTLPVIHGHQQAEHPGAAEVDEHGVDLPKPARYLGEAGPGRYSVSPAM
jgi:hypothetical protein